MWYFQLARALGEADGIGEGRPRAAHLVVDTPGRLDITSAQVRRSGDPAFRESVRTASARCGSIRLRGRTAGAQACGAAVQPPDRGGSAGRLGN